MWMGMQGLHGKNGRAVISGKSFPQSFLYLNKSIESGWVDFSFLLFFSSANKICIKRIHFFFNEIKTNVLVHWKLDVLVNSECKIAQEPACQSRSNVLAIVPVQNSKMWLLMPPAEHQQIYWLDYYLPPPIRCLFVQSCFLAVDTLVSSWAEGWMKSLDLQVRA